MMWTARIWVYPGTLYGLRIRAIGWIFVQAPRFLPVLFGPGLHTGTVTGIQRFDLALRLNVHFHTLVLDGVYVKSDNGALRFLRLPRPIEDDVYEVAMRTAKKMQAKLEI